MKRPLIVVLGVMLALIAAIPAVSKDWPIIPIGQPFVDEKRATASAPLGKLLEPDLVGITLAAEKFLTAMPADAYMIEPVAVKWLADAGVGLILDVREEQEFRAEHIPGAVNIPLRELPQRLDQFSENPSRPILVYCGNGHRGAVAMTILRLWGYREVHSMAGGLNGWKVAGLPIAHR